MNYNQFKQYIESARDCDEALLDIAVSNGFNRCKKEKLDFRKLMKLAALCTAAIALCITLNSEPARVWAGTIDNSLLTQSGCEVLADYLTYLDNVVTTFLIQN